jgi:hypothetical protein
MKTQNLILLAALIGGGFILYRKVIRPKLAQKEIDRAINEREQFTNLIAQAEQTPGAQIDTTEFTDFETLT